MSKRIIAILTVITILFVCVFAACEKKDNGVYSQEKDLNLVTDENGEKVLAEDGQLLVYETDEKGRYVKDENGEKVTVRHQFQPIEEDGVVEDYGFKLKLPEGWKTTDTFGRYINEDKEQECTVTVLKYLYDDYYDLCYKNHEILLDEGYNSIWEEDVDLGKNVGKVDRFIVKTDEVVIVVGIFENSGNVYKVHFASLNKEEAIKDFNTFCKAMSFKPFQYYYDITAVSKAETTAESAE